MTDVHRTVPLPDHDLLIRFQHDRTIPVAVELLGNDGIDVASEDYFVTVTSHHVYDDRGRAILLPRAAVEALEAFRTEAHQWLRQMRADH